MKFFMSFFIIASIFLAGSSFGHSGGLNSQGCHGGSKPYHCHRSASEMVPSSSGGSRLRCSAGSRSKDCVSPSTPKYSPNTIIDIQYWLVIHCKSLSPNFIDGDWGSRSTTALKRFQRAYGLKADGIIGPVTLAALQGRVTGRCF